MAFTDVMELNSIMLARGVRAIKPRASQPSNTCRLDVGMLVGYNATRGSLISRPTSYWYRVLACYGDCFSVCLDVMFMDLRNNQVFIVNLNKGHEGII